MAAPTKRRYRRNLLLIFILIGVLWSAGYWGHRNAVADVKERNVGKTEKEQIPKLFTLGLDLEGGLSVVLVPKAGQEVVAGSLEQAVDIIRNRIDALGVSEPEISVQGESILIQLPGIKDQARALDLIGTTAKLRFRPVIQDIVTGGPIPEGVKDISCLDPTTWPEDDPKEQVVFCRRERAAGQDVPRESWRKELLGPVKVEGDDVSTASAVLDPTQGWLVSLELTGRGSKKFADATKEACTKPEGPQRQIAIVLDRIIESDPVVQECPAGITGGTAQISGGFTEDGAKDLANVLKYGALPVELERSTVTTISPSLGRESLNGGLLAGMIGLGIVMLYVLFFYRGLGLIIWVGLIVHGALTLAVVVILGRTAGFALSLAGIAGLITSLGVAADSFIVYFERVKDEVISGRSVRTAVDRAWGSAWRTIVAADLVTALAAGVLYFLAVGSVRGFALMLGLATFLDLFVSRLFMHPAVWLLAQTKRFNESKTLGMRSVAGMGGTPAPVAGGGS